MSQQNQEAEANYLVEQIKAMIGSVVLFKLEEQEYYAYIRQPENERRPLPDRPTLIEFKPIVPAEDAEAENSLVIAAWFVWDIPPDRGVHMRMINPFPSFELAPLEKVRELIGQVRAGTHVMVESFRSITELGWAIPLLENAADPKLYELTRKTLQRLKEERQEHIPASRGGSAQRPSVP